MSTTKFMVDPTFPTLSGIKQMKKIVSSYIQSVTLSLSRTLYAGLYHPSKEVAACLFVLISWAGLCCFASLVD